MEIWDAYDEFENRLNYTIKRGSRIPEGAYHLVCEVVVQHLDGTFLLMQRDYRKSIWPGSWEIGASGSALQNETGIDAAKRELFEETGIQEESLREIFHYLWKEEKSIYYGYLVITDQPKDSIILQDGETIGYRWITKSELITFIESDDCIPTQRTRLFPLLKNNVI